MQSLLSKAKNGILYQEEYNVFGNFCDNDFDAFSLEAQVRLLLEFLEGLSLSSLPNSIKALIVTCIELSNPSRDIQNFKADFFYAPAIDAVSERIFLALKRLK